MGVLGGGPAVVRPGLLARGHLVLVEPHPGVGGRAEQAQVPVRVREGGFDDVDHEILQQRVGYMAALVDGHAVYLRHAANELR